MRRIVLATSFMAVLVVSTARPQQPDVLGAPRPLPVKTPAETKRLQADREALQKDGAKFTEAADETNRSALDTKRAELRAELFMLIKKLGEDRKTESAPKPAFSPKTSEGSHTTKPKDEIPGPPTTGPLNTLRSAENYYRGDDWKSALNSLKLLESDHTTFKREDRAFYHYLLGCCYRRSGDYKTALQKFREVSDAKEDEFLSECAIWQVGAIKSAQELDSQLEQLRSQRKTK